MKKAAFTLAETMIVLAILGIIAAIVVPSLIQKNIESQNRTKIKKAMTVYDTAVAKMVLMEDNIKTEDDLKTADCNTTKKYFKVSEQGSDNCQFKTADGLWWDVGSDENNASMAHPIVAFKKEDLKANTASDDKTNKAFYLATSFDENAKAFRSDDIQYEQTSGSYGDDMDKLYAFINNKKDTGNNNTPIDPNSISGKCTADKLNADGSCTINGITYHKQSTPLVGDSNNNVTLPYKCVVNNVTYPQGSEECISKVGADGPINWVAEPLPLNTADMEEAAKKEDNCGEGSGSTYSSCRSDGDYYNLAKRECVKSGGRLATFAELQALKTKEPSKYGSGLFWASEGYDSRYAYNMYDGSVISYTYKGNAYDRAVCVGQ